MPNGKRQKERVNGRRLESEAEDKKNIKYVLVQQREGEAVSL